MLPWQIRMSLYPESQKTDYHMPKRPKPELLALQEAWATLTMAERTEAELRFWRYLELVRRIHRRQTSTRTDKPRTLV